MSEESVEATSFDNQTQLDEFGLKIEFKTDHLAEAVETQQILQTYQNLSRKMQVNCIEHLLKFKAIVNLFYE